MMPPNPWEVRIVKGWELRIFSKISWMIPTKLHMGWRGHSKSELNDPETIYKSFGPTFGTIW
jgi:hypothetical protein